MAAIRAVMDLLRRHNIVSGILAHFLGHARFHVIRMWRVKSNHIGLFGFRLPTCLPWGAIVKIRGVSY